MNALARINHVVVLMLENRSFDCLLGKLYPASAQFDGLTGNEFNLKADGSRETVWPLPGTDRAVMTMPDPDPGELWTDMNQQIFGTANLPDPPPPASMSGFVQNYQTQPKPRVPKNIMHYFTPDQVPVLSTLAKSFAVSDRWHAAAPCQTWPNRFFMHTATAGGYENNMPVHFPYEMPTIFQRFSDAGQSWKIYFEDIPQALTLSQLWRHLDRFAFLDAFKVDARTGKLPAYSFIEPRYFADLHLPNDMHPPHIVTLGERLVADVYNALRAGPGWTETLLIITFDEHGGCYDHVPPPKAVPPSARPSQPFNFDRYGVRIPTILVSPFIPAGTILRPPAAPMPGPMPGETTPFDHTSILKLLRNRFGLGAPLTDRDAAAPDPSDVLSLPQPTNLGPDHVTPLPHVALPADFAAAVTMPLNGMQQALVSLAHHLPDTSGVVTAQAAVDTHLTALAQARVPPIDPAQYDMVSATTLVRRKMAGLFANPT
jgi:phospholipase C